MKFLFEREVERNKSDNRVENHGIPVLGLGVGGACIIPQNNNKPKPLFRQKPKK